MEGTEISEATKDVLGHHENGWEETENVKVEPEEEREQEFTFFHMNVEKNEKIDEPSEREEENSFPDRLEELQETADPLGANGGVRPRSVSQKTPTNSKQSLLASLLSNPGPKPTDNDRQLQNPCEGSTWASKQKRKAAKDTKSDGSAKRKKQTSFSTNGVNPGNPSSGVNRKGPRYPQRLRKQPDGPDADEFIHCYDCSQDYRGDCPVHGPLLIVEDTPITLDINDKFRAKKTAPPRVAVADSKIPDAGSGVWAREAIPARTRFGPYEGVIVPPETCTAYAWLVRKNGKPDHCVDASELGLSNWMRFVNCARHEGEQNLEAFQYKGKIYYKTLRRVAPHEELLVWYGDEYGRQLGIDPEFCDAEDAERWREMTYKCPGPDCPYAFTSPLYLEGHKRRCRLLRLSTSMAEKNGTFENDKSGTPNPLLLPDKTSFSSNLSLSLEEDPLERTSVSTGNLEIDSSESRQGDEYFPQEERLASPMEPCTEKEPVVCKVCNESFPDNDTLATHRRTHRNEKRLVCDICSKAFVRKHDFKRHQLTHSGERPYVCGQCKERFSQKSHLKRHRHVHTREKTCGCSFCHQYFDENLSLLFTEEESVLCNICKESFPGNDALVAHRAQHKNEKRLVCDTCSKAFARKHDFMRHQLTHSGERPYACSQCKERFSQKAHLKRHEAVHTGEKNYACSFCDKRFSGEKPFKRHALTHTSAFVCRVCQETFSDEESLNNHVETHEKSKRFACPECNKQFAENYYLNKHMQTHSLEKLFVCDECNERFSQRGHLTKHMRKHSGEKPFACSECDKLFLRNDDLKVHLRLHRGEKPYSCTECGDRFSLSQHLKRHLRMHSGEKPFACSECNKQFADRGPLKNHLLTHRVDKFASSE